MSFSDLISPQKTCFLHVLLDNELTALEWMKAACCMTKYDFVCVTQEEKDWFYVFVSRLKRDGYIKSVGKTQSSGTQGGRPKEVYRITEDGRQAHKKALSLLQKIFYFNDRELKGSACLDIEDSVRGLACEFDETEACDKCNVRPCPNDQIYE